MDPYPSSERDAARSPASDGGTPTRVWVVRAAVVYFALATAALVAPVHTWLGDHIEPRVAGLPWSLVWVLLIILANFVVLALLHRARVVDHRES